MKNSVLYNEYTNKKAAKNLVVNNFYINTHTHTHLFPTILNKFFRQRIEYLFPVCKLQTGRSVLCFIGDIITYNNKL